MKASAHHGTVFLALCGMTAFWGSAAWAADAEQDTAPVQDGIHYFSVKPEDGNRNRNYNNDGAVGTDSLSVGDGAYADGTMGLRPWATMPTQRENGLWPSGADPGPSDGMPLPSVRDPMGKPKEPMPLLLANKAMLMRSIQRLWEAILKPLLREPWLWASRPRARANTVPASA